MQQYSLIDFSRSDLLEIKINTKKQNNNLIEYTDDSYFSPSHITVNNTKDFNDFLNMVSKSTQIRKFPTENKNEEIKENDLINKTKKFIIKSSTTPKLNVSLLDSQMNLIFKDSLLNKISINNFSLNKNDLNCFNENFKLNANLLNFNLNMKTHKFYSGNDMTNNSSFINENKTSKQCLNSEKSFLQKTNFINNSIISKNNKNRQFDCIS